MQPFLATQLEIDGRTLDLATRSWPCLADRLPRVARFVEGMAGAALDGDVIRATALLLHEELVHYEHCSVVGARGPGGPVVGQNWDWPVECYDHPSVVRQRGCEGPDILTYAVEPDLRGLILAHPELRDLTGEPPETTTYCWDPCGYVFHSDPCEHVTVEPGWRRGDAPPPHLHPCPTCFPQQSDAPEDAGDSTADTEPGG